MKLADLEACRKIVIWGMGRDGCETFRAIRERAPKVEVLAFDESHQPPDWIPPGCFISFAAAMQMLRNREADLLIRSPGVSIYRREITELRALGVRIRTSLDLWLSSYCDQTHSILVSGTKGKSTTSSLIDHIFRQAGLQSTLLGNIGVPMLSCMSPPPFTVIEASSYQLSDLTTGPSVGVLLNLYQEHLDWHQTKENYYADKLRLFDLPNIRTRVACYSDKELRTRLKQADDVTWYDRPAAGFWTDGSSVMFGNARLLDAADIRLRGRHNMTNICAALTAAHASINKDPQSMADAVRTFDALEHRLQEVGQRNGVRFISDSISTTTDSALAAVQAFNSAPVILIVGGKDRGLQFEDFLKLLEGENVKHVVFTGESGRRAYGEIREAGLSYGCSYEEGLEAAVKRAVSVAMPGDTVLLSPASPSYGEFKSFEERGRMFSELVAKL